MEDLKGCTVGKISRIVDILVITDIEIGALIKRNLICCGYDLIIKPVCNPKTNEPCGERIEVYRREVL